MRGFYAVAIWCAFVTSGEGSERAASLVNSFQVMCTLEPLNFAKSEAKAAAMRLPVRQDLHSPPDPSGGSIHSKSWLLPLKTGPHEFTVAEGRGPRGEVKTCGIGAPDVGGDDLKLELMKAMKLGRPMRESRSPDGAQRTTVWLYGPENLDLMLTDGTPKNQPGIYLLLLKKPSAQ